MCHDRPRRGRPLLVEGRLDHQVAIAVTSQQWDAWQDEAAAAGYASVASYLRESKLNAAPAAVRAAS